MPAIFPGDQTMHALAGMWKGVAEHYSFKVLSSYATETKG